MVIEGNDREVVDACRCGDTDAFRLLFETYKDRVYSIALRYSGDATVAMDIVQDTFLKLLSSIRDFRGDANFETWLFRLVVNRCLDHHRRGRRLMPMVSDLLDLVRSSGETVLHEMLRTEFEESVQEVVGTLSDEQRIVVVLRYTEGLTYEQIAEILGCSTGTVGSRLNRAHKVLERRLSHLRRTREVVVGMHNSNPRELWLEPVLERHLGQVVAPEELWDRIRNPAPTKVSARRRKRVPRHHLLLTAAALMAAAVWAYLPQSTNLEFRSSTTTEIRAWVMSTSGLDIPLPSRPGPAVQLAGVCAVRGKMPTVEVSYRVSGHQATLRVSKESSAGSSAASSSKPGDGKHRFLKCESNGGTRVSSWTMRGELYTLAYAPAGESRDECLLCHAGTHQLTLVD